MYVSSSRNPADSDARKFRLSDAMLSPMKWNFVEQRFGYKLTVNKSLNFWKN